MPIFLSLSCFGRLFHPHGWSNFQWKSRLEGKSIQSKIVKLEGFSFQKGIILAWMVFHRGIDWLWTYLLTWSPKVTTRMSMNFALVIILKCQKLLAIYNLGSEQMTTCSFFFFFFVRKLHNMFVFCWLLWSLLSMKKFITSGTWLSVFRQSHFDSKDHKLYWTFNSLLKIIDNTLLAHDISVLIAYIDVRK